MKVNPVLRDWRFCLCRTLPTRSSSSKTNRRYKQKQIYSLVETSTLETKTGLHAQHVQTVRKYCGNIRLIYTSGGCTEPGIVVVMFWVGATIRVWVSYPSAPEKPSDGRTSVLQERHIVGESGQLLLVRNQRHRGRICGEKTGRIWIKKRDIHHPTPPVSTLQPPGCCSGLKLNIWHHHLHPWPR